MNNLQHFGKNLGVCIFGSHFRGDANADSDIDILVVTGSDDNNVSKLNKISVISMGLKEVERRAVEGDMFIKHILDEGWWMHQSKITKNINNDYIYIRNYIDDIFYDSFFYNNTRNNSAMQVVNLIYYIGKCVKLNDLNPGLLEDPKNEYVVKRLYSLCYNMSYRFCHLILIDRLLKSETKITKETFKFPYSRVILQELTGYKIVKPSSVDELTSFIKENFKSIVDYLGQKEYYQVALDYDKDVEIIDGYLIEPGYVFQRIGYIYIPTNSKDKELEILGSVKIKSDDAHGRSDRNSISIPVDSDQQLRLCNLADMN